MNTPKSSKKTVVVIIIIIVVALIAYFYYEGTLPATDSTLQVSTASQNGQAVGANVLSLLSQIKSLKIDTTIFTDPAYQTLRDYTVAIPQENVGRSNPFAPIPGMSSTSGSRSSGAKN